ncbi:MAG TPA: hypothetical protein VFR94_09445 [Nitrososphaeraceae archaeon]|nr:hypothetical protein [Nitrososphaeraceae archaeon]
METLIADIDILKPQETQPGISFDRINGKWSIEDQNKNEIYSNKSLGSFQAPISYRIWSWKFFVSRICIIPKA